MWVPTWPSHERQTTRTDWSIVALSMKPSSWKDNMLLPWVCQLLPWVWLTPWTQSKLIYQQRQFAQRYFSLSREHMMTIPSELRRYPWSVNNTHQKLGPISTLMSFRTAGLVLSFDSLVAAQKTAGAATRRHCSNYKAGGIDENHLSCCGLKTEDKYIVHWFQMYN